LDQYLANLAIADATVGVIGRNEGAIQIDRFIPLDRLVRQVAMFVVTCFVDPRALGGMEANLAAAKLTHSMAAVEKRMQLIAKPSNKRNLSERNPRRHFVEPLHHFM
jgi:hypothetical protein